jgi:hypothetical protein
MNQIPILPNRLDWPSAIGNFLLNFGTLECLVFICSRSKGMMQNYSESFQMARLGELRAINRPHQPLQARLQLWPQENMSKITRLVVLLN